MVRAAVMSTDGESNVAVSCPRTAEPSGSSTGEAEQHAARTAAGYRQRIPTARFRRSGLTAADRRSPFHGPAVDIGNARWRVRAMGAFLTNDSAGSSRGRLVISEAGRSVLAAPRAA